MYTIKVAALRAGVSPEAVRAWERRYGVVAPTRTESGYRLYDDDAIARLVAMRRLIDAGWAARLAAAEVIKHGPGAAASAPRGAPAAGVTAEELTNRFVAAAAALDGAALAGVLDDMFARASFERAVEDLLFPALRSLGSGWASGQVSIAAEHAATSAVARRLSVAFEAAGRPSDGASGIVVGLPPGGRHELGALVFATVARRAGLPVAYLGADLPADDWVTAASRARAAVMAVVVAPDAAAALSVVDRLHRAYPQLVVGLGGPHAPRGAHHVRLPDGPVEALNILQQALAKQG